MGRIYLDNAASTRIYDEVAGEMFALAKTSGGNDSNGTIVVFPKDDGTEEWNIARVIEESKGAVAAPSDMWDRTTVYMNETRRLWDFSSALKGNRRAF